MGVQPYHEYDNADPKSIYGKYKRAERYWSSPSSKFFIVRTSWMYGKYCNNFVKTMLKLGQEKPLLQVVDDQKGSPTYTVDLARFLLMLIQTEKYGVYIMLQTLILEHGIKFIQAILLNHRVSRE